MDGRLAESPREAVPTALHAVHDSDAQQAPQTFRAACPDCSTGTARPDTGKCDGCTRATLDAGEFLTAWIRHNAAPGGWVKPGTAIAAAEAIGYKHATVKAARQRSSGPRIEASGEGRGSMWRIAPKEEIA